MTVHRSFATWIALSALACSSSSQTAAEGPATPATARPQVAPPLVAQTEATFAATKSGPIIQAALTYPQAIVDDMPAAPLSLTASDGTGLELVSMDARAVIDGPLAFTELRLSFRNPRDRVLEGRFSITLPDGAAISRLAMKINGAWMEAEVVERQRARRAYEDFLHRKQDPALMEKEAGNEFRARIFPIPAKGVKDIIISYSQELPASGARYTLPLRGLPAIGSVTVDAQVANRSGRGVTRRHVRLSQRGWKPDRDFVIQTSSKLAGLRNRELVVARIAPNLPTTRAPMGSAMILFDTSASRAPGFSREVRRLGELVTSLGGTYGGATQITVAAFDQAVQPIYSGPASGFGKAQLDMLRARRPLGASDLAGALAWVGKAQGFQRLIIVSDAIATAGRSDGDDVRAAAAALKGRIDRIDAILVGGIRDTEIAARMVRGTVARDGVVADGALPIKAIAVKLARGTRSGIKVAVKGAVWVWPSVLDGVQPGDEVVVYAALGGKAATSERPVELTLSGAISQRVTITPARVARPLIQRAAARAEIARLAAARDALAKDAKASRAALRKQMIDLSTRYRVLSPFTALLVLETDSDYRRFGIDRKALADIMTVGQRGIEVTSRTKPVLIVERPAKPRPMKNIADKSGGKSKEKPGGAKKMRTSLDDDDDDEFDSAPLSENKAEAPAPRESVTTVSDVRTRSGEADGTVAGGVASPDVGAEPVAAVDEPRAPPAPPAVTRRPSSPTRIEAAVSKPKGPPPLAGKLADVMKMIQAKNVDGAVVAALTWRNEKPGDLMALIALGEALEARGSLQLAARAYGSIIDLFPSRADMRRFAGQRLERLAKAGATLARDSYAKAVAQRPDHLTGHRLLAYALLRDGDLSGAFAALEAGIERNYPSGRFRGAKRILREDLGLVAAAWVSF